MTAFFICLYKIIYIRVNILRSIKMIFISHNIIMYVVYILFAIFLILLSLLLIRFRIRLVAHFDIIEGRQGFFTLSILRISLFSGKIKLIGNKLELTTKKGKKSTIKITYDKEDEQSIVNYLDNAVVRVVDILALDIFFTAGKSDDAFFGAMASGVAKVFINIIACLLKSRYPNMHYTEGAMADFGQDNLHISLNSILTLSIADIIYSLIYAQIITDKSRYKKAEKRRLRYD